MSSERVPPQDDARLRPRLAAVEIRCDPERRPDGKLWGEATPIIVPEDAVRRTEADMRGLILLVAAARVRCEGKNIPAQFQGGIHIGADGNLALKFMPVDLDSEYRFP